MHLSLFPGSHLREDFINSIRMGLLWEIQANTGAGAFIVDHHGNWIIVSYRPIPTATSIEAELWALSLDNPEIEVDAASVIHLLSNVNVANFFLAP
ncbi:hypothetical protein GOBAR_DD27598 [Gossypium barbadense]|nr:hypothetical protein GOBAR_DD27598 [Gossypium barbadense]